MQAEIDAKEGALHKFMDTDKNKIVSDYFRSLVKKSNQTMKKTGWKHQKEWAKKAAQARWNKKSS